MKKLISKNWLFLFSFLVIFSFMQFLIVNSVSAECKEGDGKICLNVPLSGLDEGVSTEGGAVGIFKEYVGAIYVFGAGLVLVVAVIMIIIGGYETMFKGGVEGNIAGKERIIQALLGVVLVFLSALILHSINPTFFKFGDDNSSLNSSTTSPSPPPETPKADPNRFYRSDAI